MTAPAPTGNLPVAVTTFVGRRREITEVRRLMSVSRLVTLTGVGGVGKTRLALEAAAQSRRSFPDGVWLVDLAALEDGSQVAQTVANTVGVLDQSTRPPAEKVAELLLRRQALIILDNCEHLLDDCAAFADGLLRAAPGVRVLATSRRPLEITGEHLFTVPPLSMPDPEHAVDAEALGQYDAVSLLAERAAAVHPGFAVTERNHTAVARLCARLDGIPLAIELAVTRLRVLSVKELVDRLEDRFALLTSGSRVALPRQQTLRALIDWSYALCMEQERLLWTRLSVFSGGFDLPAAEGICSGDGLEPASIVDLVDQLVAQSIVIGEHRDAGVRFRLLETIRQYGRERLAESGQEAALRRRHRDFYLARAQRVADGWCGPGQEAALAQLRADHGDLRAALELCMSDPDGPQAALLMTAALRQHWYADGFLPEGRRWVDRALDLPGQPVAERTTALWVAAWVSLLQGDHDIANSRLEECEALAKEVDDRTARAVATSLRGTAALFEGDLPEAIARFEKSVVSLRESGNTHGSLMSMFQLAISLAHAGELERAAATCDQALAISQECGERWVRSYILWVLGFDTWQRGDPAAATEQTREALSIQRGFNDHVGAALMIELLAWLAAAQAEFTRAAHLLGAADSIWRKVGTTIDAFGPHLGAHHARCEQATRRALRDSQYRAAVAGTENLTVAQAIAHALNEEPKAAASSDGEPGMVLTPREREVADLVAQGRSNRAIAESLVLSPRTVDGHVERILAKLGFTARTQIAAWVTEQRARSEHADRYPQG
ncbi:ATP-binding protein [Actinomadura rudentiformis]|uniref:LuxR family transcriptional regulator n=1 Tax=Actinomadura rudentiformis TaxID=359158 RepID=A0A6H9YN85_9ACTN|nr:LuxR C-terminal-related transcriptional regulator [Actinomadura rudentiformis]KAB2348414.1 LuxR family transcriptional regulator [Actinomadura rudentiformis]